MHDYRDIFALTLEELGRTDLVQHHIDTGDHPPIRSRPYRVQTKRETIEQQINDMLDRDVTQPSASLWASPVVLVRKPDGSSRFCCDFRRLNKVTTKDSCPLPLISETLQEALGGAKYFTSLDLLSGYWQVELDAASREKTAFVTHAGLYEFKTMSFGLCNAPGTFERLMECVLRGLTWQVALIYLDDVLEYSETFEAHLQHLHLVFDRFRAAGLKLKPSKCHFCQPQVNYLGHVITSDEKLK